MLNFLYSRKKLLAHILKQPNGRPFDLVQSELYIHQADNYILRYLEISDNFVTKFVLNAGCKKRK